MAERDPNQLALTPRQIAAINHARSHDLSKPIDRCRRCKGILRREDRHA